MKIAFPATGDTLDARLDKRFARATKFLIYDLDEDSFQIEANEAGLAAVHGAGVRVAETMRQLGVQVVISVHCGPNAFRALQAAGIGICLCEETEIATALQGYRDGKLNTAQAGNTGGHWGAVPPRPGAGHRQ